MTWCLCPQSILYLHRIAKLMGAKIYLVDVDENSGQMNTENVLECIKNNNLKILKLSSQCI